MLLFLQIAVSVLFFLQKVGVLAGLRLGWLLGMVAAILGVGYFFGASMYVFTALEVGLTILMGQAWYFREKKNEKIENGIRIVTIVTMFILTLFSCAGRLTVFELLSSVGLLGGTYLLSHQKPMAGWLISLVAHSFGAYVGYGHGQMFFADMQVASLLVSLVGVIKEHPRFRR